MESRSENTATIELTKVQATILKRAIREHATGGESPALKAKRVFEAMSGGVEFLPRMYTDETIENPATADELLACFDGTRFTFTRSQNEQVQLCAMALLLEVQNAGQSEMAIEKIGSVLNDSLGVLGEGYDELFMGIPADEREKMADESAKETVEYITGVDPDDFPDGA